MSQDTPAWPTYRRLLGKASRYWPLLAVATIGMVVEGLAGGYFIKLMEDLVNDGFVDPKPGAATRLPLVIIGLFGTVVGMIQMFLGILDHGVGDVNQLAGGIGKALVCTATGMIVAIPALAFHRYFRARIGTYIVDMEHEAIALMDVLDPRGDLRPAATAGLAPDADA